MKAQVRLTEKEKADEVFYQQLLLSEKLRVQILLSFLIILIVIILTVFTVFRSEYMLLFKDPSNLPWIVISMCFFILYEFLLLNFIKYFIKTGKNFPTIGRYGNTLLEVSIPTITMVVLSSSVEPFSVLNGPAGFTYFLFIILSTLRLDFKLSFFTGLVAALEFLGLNLYYRFYTADLGAAFFSIYLFGTGKAIILFLCGIVAGFVSLQIKKTVMNALSSMEERNKIVSVFGQQVSQEIAEELILNGEGGSGIVRNVCVMFLDIRNFTSMVQDKNPKEIVAYQNEIFGMAINAIHKHKGIINQFLGDGFMATFGIPEHRGSDCLNAVTAALEIIEDLNKKNYAKNLLFPTKVGIGIHYGEAVTGNVGSSVRQQYSITGNVVITASRLEQMNKEFNSQLLISREVLDNLDSGIKNYQSLGSVNIKGRQEPIEIIKLC